MADHDRLERTDQLETTIHSIESSQQTGILKVERAKGGVREMAAIVFLNGRVVEAIAGNHTAQDALDWAMTWGSCRYTFDVKSPSEIIVPPPPAPASDETGPSTSPLSFISQAVQKYTHTLSDAASTAEEAVPEKSEEDTTSPLPIPGASIPAPYPLSPQVRGPQVEVAHSRAPFRLLNGREAVDCMERFGLSRLHRHVFFLLDGQRTTVDVVRLTGRSFYEIQGLLMELERLGLIKMEHASLDEAMNGI